jgi:hypothetical protein
MSASILNDGIIGEPHPIPSWLSPDVRTAVESISSEFPEEHRRWLKACISYFPKQYQERLRAGIDNESDLSTALAENDQQRVARMIGVIRAVAKDAKDISRDDRASLDDQLAWARRFLVKKHLAWHEEQAIRRAVISATGMAEILKQSRFRLRRANEVAGMEPIKWRIKGVLPQIGLGVIYGASATGKSLLAADMAAAVAAGRPWFELRTTACPVTICALEAPAGLPARISAYRIRHGEISNDVSFLTQPFNLLDKQDVADLVTAVRRNAAKDGIIIIDTLNRATPGIDENSSSDMGNVIAAMSELQGQVGGLVLLVHHSGKDAAKGMRGHSSLFAALDCAIEVTRSGDRRVWKVDKAKDSEDGKTYPFRLEVVDVGINEDLDLITSCVVQQEKPAGEAFRAMRVPAGGNQKIIYDGLRALLVKSPERNKGGAPEHLPVVALDEAIAKLRGSLATEERRKSERTQQAITGLINGGFVRLSEGWLWIDF